MTDFDAIAQMVGELDEEGVIDALNKLMEENPADAPKAMEACQRGMAEVGDRFESQEYFISDLLYAGELMEEAVDILKPALVSGDGTSFGKMIMCTVAGDLHDIGKNIVISMLKAAGFDVIDLGTDVSADKIVQTAKENNIKIIALSGVLTLAIDAMKATVDAFSAAGMRDDVKIIIGGCPVSEQVRLYSGADAWALNPQDTVEICKNWSQNA